MNHLKDAIDFACQHGKVKQFLEARNNENYYPISIHAKLINREWQGYIIYAEITFDYHVLSGNQGHYEDFFVWLGWNDKERCNYLIHVAQVQEL